MTFRFFAAGLALLVLTACGAEPQYLPEAAPSKLRVRAAVDTLLVQTVSLPTYAADDKISYQDAEGVVRSRNFGLWADEPERATTLAMTRHLNAMTSAKVASEPWPLPEPPTGVLDIRFETMIATNSNTFRIKGQYYMGSEIPDPITYDDPDKEPKELPAPLADKVGLFDIAIPLPEATPAAITRAQAAALTALAERIARDLSR
ncbi:PqiC family protein [Pseudoponticoccus marisrubri]|uniref:ABC-type transport auxiliary lipoprotein component domain-containing protein n=1 Tax=Pseudoponticoccus marisrubri TaxID=1685382 RepID=A0A0W7WID3_9RHOB|nr:ABC-type transport auxiliary lipoprotein family protein [Pseudoponticoccus marisrubri]KUF10387.1 hypothetical protein AVJ23_13395 [Pseudoponticoccus marisrubri]